MHLRGLRDFRAWAFIALMVCQTLCVAFFVVDIARDFREQEYTVRHMTLEVLANLGLIIGVIVEAYFFFYMLRQQASAERTISAASGALGDVIQDYYAQWGLTPTEADVATFTIKGFSIAEVAKMRGSAEGTIKNHLNSIYRKAGLTGRGQLVSLLIEDLLNGGLPVADGAGQGFNRHKPANGAISAATSAGGD